jgi:ABC-type sugar transport system ATPase subunit
MSPSRWSAGHPILWRPKSQIGCTQLDDVTLGVRGEHVVLRPALESQVYEGENHGVEKIVILKVAEHSLKATVPAHMAIEVDSAISFAIDSGKLQLFAAQTRVNLVSEKEETNHG